MFRVDIMTSFGPMCVVTSAIARSIPIFKLAYFWNAKTYTGEILIWRHIDGVLSEKPKNTHHLTSLFFNGCLGWKFKNCWNDCTVSLWWLILNGVSVMFAMVLLLMETHVPSLITQKHIVFGLVKAIPVIGKLHGYVTFINLNFFWISYM